MRNYKTFLLASAACLLASGAYADGGPVPEEAPPPPPEEAPAWGAEEAAAAPSHNEFVMVLELGAGWSLIDEGADISPFSDLDDDSYPLIEGGGRANVPLSADWALQLDAEGLATFTDRDDGENNLQTVFSGAAHLNYRQPDYALGILAQLGSSNGGENENANFYNFGGEGLYNWTDLTGILQAGYFWADDENENDVMTEAWWVRGVARFYPGPDTRFQAEGSYADGEERNSSIDTTAIGWGARADHAFTGGPVAFFLSYKGNYIENDSPFEPDNYITDHTALVGLRVHFGDAGSLKESDRNGPSFDTPDVGRWTGYTLEVVDD